jgi:DNA-binding IclR family transcriptional regulator
MARPSPQTDRVVAVVELLTLRPDQPHTLASLTRHLDTNKSTCLSTLSALVRAGWLLRDPFRKTYRLGPKLATVGQVAIAGFPALEFVRPLLARLSHECAANCAAVAVEGDHFTVLEQARDLRALPPGLDFSVPIPLRAPLGSVVVAWADDAGRDAWLGPLSETVRSTYSEVLDATRRRGYSVELVTRPETQLRELMDDRPDPTAGLGPMLERLVDQLAAGDDFLVAELDPQARYLVSTVDAPVFVDDEVRLLLSLNGFGTALTGRQVAAVGERLAAATATVTAALQRPRD